MILQKENGKVKMQIDIRYPVTFTPSDVIAPMEKNMRKISVKKILAEIFWRFSSNKSQGLPVVNKETLVYKYRTSVLQ